MKILLSIIVLLVILLQHDYGMAMAVLKK